MPPSTNKKDASKGRPRAGELNFARMAEKVIYNLPLGVVTFNAQLRITDCNLSAQNMLATADNVAEVLDAGSDGQSDIRWDQRLSEALALGEPCTFDNVAYRHDRRSRTLHIICTPMSDEKSGEILGGILLIEDITAKMLMEDDLASSERLAAVGKLAARVAHELNNPLDGILRYINLALRLADEHKQDNSSRYLRESRKGLLRMVQIISELLEFSRSTYSAFEQADINKIVEDAARAMNSQGSDNHVEIIRRYADKMPNVRSGNLFQVFCNLIKNAIDAMPDGGKLEFRTSCDDENALIEFADTGSGLSEEIKQKLFEPFFTTKMPGKGTGLGLAICKDIVERYNGRIEAENRPEGGSVFTVSIPLESTNSTS